MSWFRTHDNNNGGGIPVLCKIPGASIGFAGFHPGPAVFMDRYNPAGSLLSSFSSPELSNVFDIAADSSGNFALVGPIPGNPTHARLLKLDGNGNSLWARDDLLPSNSSHNGVAFDSIGNVIATGTFSNGGASSWRTKKYDALGNTLWIKDDLAGTNSSGFDVAVDASNNIFITGDDQTGPGPSYTQRTLKFDSSGNTLWAMAFPAGANGALRQISVDSWGNLFVTSYAAGKTRISKYDPGGNTVWARDYGDGISAYEPAGLACDSQGGVAAVGTISGSFNTHGYAVKWDPNGQQVWSTQSRETLDRYSAVVFDGAGDAFAASFGPSGPPKLSKFFGYACNLWEPSSASAGKAVWAVPVPAKRGERLCLGTESKASEWDWEAFNSAGERVARLYSSCWQLSNLASGLYILKGKVKLASGEKTFVQKIVIR